MKRILALLFATLLFSENAAAAVTANSVVTAQTPNRGIVQFLQGTDSAGTYKTVYTSGANGSKIVALYMTTNDTTTHLVTCQVVNGGVQYGGVALTTVNSAGFANGTPPQSLMFPSVWVGLPVSSDGNPYLILISGDTLQCTFATNLSGAGKLINIQAIAADF